MKLTKGMYDTVEDNAYWTTVFALNDGCEDAMKEAFSIRAEVKKQFGESSAIYKAIAELWEVI